MSETTYKCPKCSATLKPGKPIPAGKKIKCPKCETIFAPGGAAPAAAAAAKPAARPALEDEEDAGGTYGIKEEAAPPPPPKAETEPEDEDDEDDGKKKKKKQPEQGDLEKQLLARQQPKRKKGAAQATCQKPSNQMLATSCTVCASCILTVMMALWPLVFSKKSDAPPPTEAKASKAVAEAPKLKNTEMELIGMVWPSWLIIVFAVIAFIYNGAIAIGTVKMQAVESYQWAMAASFLMMLPVNWGLAIPAFAWFLKILDSILGSPNPLTLVTVFVISVWFVYVGFWNLTTLRKADVLEGFNEKDPVYAD
jgi:hypothetical protein